MPSDDQGGWSSFFSCCGSGHDYDESHYRHSKEPIVHIQPGQFTHLSAERLIQEARHGTGRITPKKETRWSPGLSPASSIWSRSWLSPTSSARRLRISAPMNFRHIESDSFMPVPTPSETIGGGLRRHESLHPGLQTHFEEPEEEEQEDKKHHRQQQQQQQQQQNILNEKHLVQHDITAELEANERPPSFHPLELELKDVSPLLPYFDAKYGRITPPLPVHLTGTEREISPLSDWSSRSPTLRQQRSFSSLSFHVPRGKHFRDASTASTAINSTSTSPTTVVDNVSVDISPPVPTRSRVRTSATSELGRIVERIASSILESERIQERIDSVVGRQSIYLGNSRPTTADGPVMLRDLTPMYSIPAVPAAAPSFSQRLSTAGTAVYDNTGNPVYLQQRPQTAPSQTQMTAVLRPLPQSSRSDFRHLQQLQRQQEHSQQQWPAAQFSQQPSVLSPPQRYQSYRQAPMPEEIELAAAAFQGPPMPRQSYARVGQTDGARDLYEDAASFDQSADLPDLPLSPPLPLVLRPPLRKKKSFSRVSTWLFPDTAPAHGQSKLAAVGPSSSLLGSEGGVSSSRTSAIKSLMAAAGSAVPARGGAAEFFGVATTEPRQIKDSDGFYQVVAVEPPAGVVLSPRRGSDGSAEVFEETQNYSADSSHDEDRDGKEEDAVRNGDDKHDHDEDNDDDALTKVGDSEFDHTTTTGEHTVTTSWSLASNLAPRKQQQQQQQQQQHRSSSSIASPPMLFADAVGQPTTVMVAGKLASAASVAERRFTAAAVASPRMGDAAAPAGRNLMPIGLGPNGHRPTSVGVAY